MPQASESKIVFNSLPAFAWQSAAAGNIQPRSAFEIRDACAAEPSLTVARRDRAGGARPVELDVLLQSRTEMLDANALRDFREASTVKRR